MTTKAVSTRRRFFWQAGAAVSAPLAVSSALASQDGVERAEGSQSRLAALEDVNAIRALHQTYARLVNAGASAEIAKLFADPSEVRVDESIRSLSADGFGEQDLIEVSADRRTATARTPCIVHSESAIEPSCPLVEMARQQGEGVLRRSERRVLENAYVKQGGVWKIERSAYRPA
jgi:hypothetical protein